MRSNLFIFLTFVFSPSYFLFVFLNTQLFISLPFVFFYFFIVKLVNYTCIMKSSFKRFKKLMRNHFLTFLNCKKRMRAWQRHAILRGFHRIQTVLWNLWNRRTVIRLVFFGFRFRKLLNNKVTSNPFFKSLLLFVLKSQKANLSNLCIFPDILTSNPQNFFFCPQT